MCIFRCEGVQPTCTKSEKHLPTQLLQTCRRNKKKRRAYDQQIRDIEHSSFTPLIFSTSGGLGPAATVAYKRLAVLLSEKQGKQYRLVMNWIRCKLSFSLPQSSITSLRGYRSPRKVSGTTTNSIKLESIVCRIPQ